MFRRPLVLLTDEELNLEVNRLVSDRVAESVTLDYKSEINLDTPSSRKAFAEDLTAFANEVGGLIVVGVKTEQSRNGEGEVPSLQAQVGVEPVSGLLERMQNIAADMIHPRLGQWSARVIEVEAGRVVYCLEVEQSVGGPHMVGGRFYHRSGHRSQPMEEHLVRERYAQAFARLSSYSEFLNSTDLRQVQATEARNLSLRVALVPVFPVHELVDFSLQLIQRVQVLLNSHYQPRLTWFGLESIPVPEAYWRFYDSGAIVSWQEAPLTRLDGSPQQGHSEPLLAPFSYMLEGAAQVLRMANAIYEHQGSPPRTRLSVLWTNGTVNPTYADWWAGDRRISYPQEAAAFLVRRREGSFVVAEHELRPADIADPRDSLRALARDLGRYHGVANAHEQYLDDAPNDGLNIKVGRRSYPLWPRGR